MSNQFIIIYKSMLQSINKNIEDCYVYSLILSLGEIKKEKIVLNTSISILVEQMKCSLRGKKRDRKREMKSSIIRLVKLGLIKSNCGDKTRVNDFIRFESIIKSEKFIKVERKTFKLFDDFKKYYFYCWIASGEKYGNRLSYENISERMGISKEKVRLMINEMNNDKSKPRIYKFSGSFQNGNSKQDMNRYFIKLNKELLDQWSTFYNKDGTPKNTKTKTRIKNDDMVYGTAIGEVTVLELKKYIQASKWKSGSILEIEYDDYELYKICEREEIDHKFVGMCKYRIEGYQDSVDYDGRFELFEEQYKKDMLEAGIEYHLR